jgi:hypothetical protein
MNPYFYTDKHNKPQGPVDKNELQKFGVNSSTLVWKQGMKDWQSAGSLAELKEMFPPPLSQNTPPPVPPFPLKPIMNSLSTVEEIHKPVEKNLPPTYLATSEKKLPDNDNNSIVYSGKANRFLNYESVGGNLFLFKNKMQFKSHSLNIQNHVFEIELNQIKEVSFFNTLGLVPNGLAVANRNGTVEKFVVYNRKIWKTEIDKLISGNTR